MLDKKRKIQCPWCFKISSLGEWDDTTYSKCTNREMKRLYTSLTQKKAFKSNGESYYLCPICGKWSKGNELKLIEDK